jgi:N-acetylglucosamine-6-phosphate deacetylase
MGPGRFTIGGVDAVVGDDLVPRSRTNPAQFAGSALTMPTAERNLRQHLHLDDASIQRLLSQNACRAIGFARQPA